MLALTRTVDESVIVTCRGVRIRITVLSLADGKVRLGFEAPNEVNIHREENQRIIDQSVKRNHEGNTP